MITTCTMLYNKVFNLSYDHDDVSVELCHLCGRALVYVHAIKMCLLVWPDKEREIPG